jgi:hypothetical protein
VALVNLSLPDPLAAIRAGVDAKIIVKVMKRELLVTLIQKIFHSFLQMEMKFHLNVNFF